MEDRTVQTETRRLAAIMFTDMVGFSRQMGTNEAHTLHLLAVHNQIIQQAVTEHHGSVIKTVGDQQSAGKRAKELVSSLHVCILASCNSSKRS